jgi:nitroreductase
MEFDEVVRKRRMIRNFAEEPISDASLERILDQARYGPSAGFSQGQDFILVQEQARKQAIASLCSEANYVSKGFAPFISGAAALIIPCTNENAYHRRYQEPDKVRSDGSEIEWPVPYWHMDVGAAVMTILLAAVNEGLGAAFAGVRDLAALRELLGIPDEVTPMGVICLGHPAPDRRSPSLQRGRRSKREVVHHEAW